MDNVKLICLPYAGGSARVYSKWVYMLDNRIEVVCPELAGRGKRFNEPYYKNLKEAVDDIYKNIRSIINSGPYALFGHSMGSLLTFELYYKLKEEGHCEPEAIFFSGKAAPNIPIKEKVHLYSEEQILEKISSLGGTPREVLDNKDILNLYLPIIKADYKIIETYEYKNKSSLINSPCNILYGSEDDIALEELLEWENHTFDMPKFYKIYGGHFFIKNQENMVINLLNQILLDKMIVNV
ncbi:thioesterase II family protein [Bacillus cereus group sp. Bce002]|uniref:thioesterase II family protein n=1 Tax=Bacillus cereus group sp. Bce002 TaxID=3445259 RepID=UPI003F23C240